MNIFHANVNGLESKFDTLNNFLAGATSPIDIVALTETSEDSVNSFISNVSVDDYSLFSTPTNSSKGGVCLYVNSEFDAFERSDLKVQNDLFEMVWIEIKNKNSKNVLCAYVYRHPRYEMDDFLAIMDSSLKKITDEGKEIYMCGDFNIDLLKMNSVSNYLTYYNLLNCYGLLPLIIHPTRVVEGQVPSLVDNIFTNNSGEEILSGNIYLTLSEHFSQFASVVREKIDVKKVNMQGRDFSKFSSRDFYDDVSIQPWNYNLQDPNILMSEFIWRLEGCTERHAPMKKLSPKEIKTKLKP